MPRAPGEAVQRVCPSCSTVAYTAAGRCPWCGAGYVRRLWPVLLVLALLQTALVLGGVAYMLVAAGEELDRRIDRAVVSVERDIQRDIDGTAARVEEAVRAELDRRLPALP